MTYHLDKTKTKKKENLVGEGAGVKNVKPKHVLLGGYLVSGANEKVARKLTSQVSQRPHATRSRYGDRKVEGLICRAKAFSLC